MENLFPEFLVLLFDLCIGEESVIFVYLYPRELLNEGLVFIRFIYPGNNFDSFVDLSDMKYRIRWEAPEFCAMT